jgi:hypothetical protein
MKLNNSIKLVGTATVVVIAGIYFSTAEVQHDNPILKGRVLQESTSKTFTENFGTTYKVSEINNMGASNNANWWVSSGAYFYSANNIGNTILGALPASDPRRTIYAVSNPTDTDNGYHPQNIFRLVTRNHWKNFQQQVYFRIKKVNLSSSSNRNESNGILLFNRYQDAFNLYYAGVRVDGAAVIKKKIKGTYYTMAYDPIFPGHEYDRESSPNLLPLNSWIGLRTVVKTNTNGSVSIDLYTDIGKTGNWKLAASATDNNKEFGGKAFSKNGHAGIRTDFMDVEFKEYSIVEQ